MYCFFFFNDTATTEIYTLSLHDALPIYHETNINIIARRTGKDVNSHTVLDGIITTIMDCVTIEDRKSGSAGMPRPISYAVFCLKKKTQLQTDARVCEADTPYTETLRVSDV